MAFTLGFAFCSPSVAQLEHRRKEKKSSRINHLFKVCASGRNVFYCPMACSRFEGVLEAEDEPRDKAAEVRKAAPAQALVGAIECAEPQEIRSACGLCKMKAGWRTPSVVLSVSARAHSLAARESQRQGGHTRARAHRQGCVAAGLASFEMRRSAAGCDRVERVIHRAGCPVHQEIIALAEHKLSGRYSNKW